MIVALRRPESPYESARFPLRGLNASAAYQFKNLDSSDQQTVSGKTLMETGLAVKLGGPPGSAVLVYERK